MSNNWNDVNGSISDSVVGIGGTSISPPSYVLTTRHPFSTRSNHINESVGDDVFTSPGLSCVTTRIPLSNLSNSRLKRTETCYVDNMDADISFTNFITPHVSVSVNESPIVESTKRKNQDRTKKYEKACVNISTEGNSAINGIHHIYGGEIKSKRSYVRVGQIGSTSMVKKKKCRRMDNSTLAESSINLFGPDRDTNCQRDTDVDYHIDVASGHSEFVEEDAEMFYDGELLYGSDNDEEDIMFSDKSSLTKEDLKIVMRVCRAESGRENFIGPSNEVGAIMVGDLEDTCGERDIIIESKADGLQRISDIHPKLMALQYPLLFPTGYKCDIMKIVDDIKKKGYFGECVGIMYVQTLSEKVSIKNYI
ncbi:hypothetical protein POM88_028818 [Heracleum sosnowskyi]|uniref:Uncharacterized protein n=1 Tax=Heracleum sosnowskyi TaxID=360622 RepID=A0AAD8HV24_9APIA|nr:hypothetical protein POM88_028818 [Heracleum sosnowskyi]